MQYCPSEIDMVFWVDACDTNLKKNNFNILRRWNRVMSLNIKTGQYL